jgi:hypothetical protein
LPGAGFPDRSVHGEKDLAIEQLNAATPLYGASSITSYGVLKLMLFWDPLRGDPSPRSRGNRPTDKKPPATLLILSKQC